MIKVNYTAQKMLLLNFQNSQMKKWGETLFGVSDQKLFGGII